MKTIILCLALLLPRLSYAAWPATLLLEMNASTTGTSNVNGGGHNPQEANAPTDLVCTSATGNAAQCTSASYTFLSRDATNLWYVNIRSGTGSGGAYGAQETGTYSCWYPISSVSGGTATLDSTVGHGFCMVLQNGQQATFQPNASAGVANTASPGGTGTWLMDMSLGNSLDLTDLVTTGSTTVSSALNPAGPHWIGNVVHINSGSGCPSNTTSWYYISNVVTVTATIDSNASAGTCAAKLGGAMSMNSTLDTDVLAKMVAGNIAFYKAGTYTMGENMVNPAVNATITAPVILEGYTTTRGDRPLVGGSQPILVFSSSVVALLGGNNLTLRNMTFTGAHTSYTLQFTGTNIQLISMKVINSATSVSTSDALYINGTGSGVWRSEIINYRGRAVHIESGLVTTLFGNYIHNSNIGVLNGSVLMVNVQGNVIEGCKTAAFQWVSAVTQYTQLISANTLYGYSSQVGIGLDMPAGTFGVLPLNNIVTGFATGLNHGTSSQTAVLSRYNDYYNNGANFTNGVLGTGDITLNPTFTSVTELANTGTVTSGTTPFNVVTDTGADFSSVVDDVDVVYLVSATGTGFVAGMYPIHAHTTTTLTLATAQNTAFGVTTSGTGSAIVYRIITGHNYQIGTNLKAAGWPGQLPGALPLGYTDIGALPRQETGSGGGTRTYPRQ